MTPEERIAQLEASLRPFAEAYLLHKTDMYVVSKLKSFMAMDTSVDHWKAAYAVIYGEQVLANVEESDAT